MHLTDARIDGRTDNLRQPPDRPYRPSAMALRRMVIRQFLFWVASLVALAACNAARVSWEEETAQSIAQLAKKPGRVTREELEATLHLSPDKYSQWRSANNDFSSYKLKSAGEKLTSVVIDNVEHEGYCNQQEITVRFAENVCLAAQTLHAASGVRYKPMEGEWVAPPDGTPHFSMPIGLTYVVRDKPQDVSKIDLDGKGPCYSTVRIVKHGILWTGSLSHFCEGQTKSH